MKIEQQQPYKHMKINKTKTYHSSKDKGATPNISASQPLYKMPRCNTIDITIAQINQGFDLN